MTHLTDEPRTGALTEAAQTTQSTTIDFGRLAGPVRPACPDGDAYRVDLVPLPSRRPRRTIALTLLAPLVEVGFLAWLLQPSHWEAGGGRGGLIAMVAMTVLLTIVELFRLVTIVSLCRATVIARNPVPVEPDPAVRVAFITTFVPGKEPVEMLETTLRAMARVRHRGVIDVFVLDEGGSEDVARLCERVGAIHFSRHGVERWNTPSGSFAAKTKHGNINAFLERHHRDYDVVCGVDTDHAPVPTYCERMLGYFRDPTIGYVASPQVYENSKRSLVARMAESQQFLFHAIIQRAGNRSRSPMFVGTNYAVRVEALMAIGGIQASITEDALTGVALHAAGWTSVYTPDVLAVGEGPSYWTDYFTQQYRWARGTMEIWRRHVRDVRRLSGSARFNYFLMFTYYPTAALTWIMGVASSVVYMLSGIAGIGSSSFLWITLYFDVVFFQTLLYVWNRRHNVSPHEPPGPLDSRGPSCRRSWPRSSRRPSPTGCSVARPSSS
ncbi:MAG: glycosyltransferase [Actinobacteria bacterium]|nr:glycosyltransferase [Actinomycetota bacterium]